MQDYQIAELDLPKRKNANYEDFDNFDTALVSGTPVFASELEVCFDCLLQCAFDSKDWSPALLRICQLIGAEPGLIEVRGAQPFVSTRILGSPDHSGSIVPYIIETNFEAVAIHFCLNFRTPITEQTTPSLTTMMAIQQHIHRCLIVMIWRWKAPDTLAQLHGLVGALSVPCALVDRDNELIAISSAGRTMFGLQNGEPWINNAEWKAALTRAKSDVGDDIIFLAGEKLLTLKAKSLAHWLGGAIVESNNLHLIEISDARCTPSQALELVHQRYNLSKNEKIVLSLALDGDNIDQIARRRGVSRETIRAQLRSCRAKTGTNSLFQLISLVHSFLPDQNPKNRASEAQIRTLDHLPRLGVSS